MNILDMACGTGSCAIHLAALGAKVSAFDSSLEMIKRARRKARQHRLSINFKIGQFLNSPINDSFDLVICIYDALNHLMNENELRQAFSNAYGLLNNNGFFVFDMNTPGGFRRNWKNYTLIREDKKYHSSWQADYNEGERLAELNITIFKKKHGNLYEKSTARFTERGYSLSEIKSALRKAGFSRIDAYACFTHNRPSSQTKRVCFKCRP